MKKGKYEQSPSGGPHAELPRRNWMDRCGVQGRQGHNIDLNLVFLDKQQITDARKVSPPKESISGYLSYRAWGMGLKI